MDIYILIIFLVLIFICIWMGAFFKVGWIPTRKKDYERIAKLANLQSHMLFCDLGSGSGNLLFYLSKKYNVNCVGVELSPLLYLYSKIKSLFYKKVKIKYRNLFNQNLSGVNVVYVFLLPDLYERLKEKFDIELPKGSRVILSSWPFKDLEPMGVSKKDNKTTYYLYQKPFYQKDKTAFG